MNIALTGASGFIGSTIAKLASEHGHAISALVRTSSRRDHIDPYVERFITGDHHDASAVNALIDHADTIIHCSFDWLSLRGGDLHSHLSSNLRGSIDLLEACDGRHFIYISTIAVHHFMLDRWNGTIDESHPSRPGSLYGACKAAVEAHLWAANATRNQPVTAIRPCAVYGIDPIVTRSIGWPIIEAFRKGESYERKGGGKFVHVEDVATATVACIGRKHTSPQVYNLVDCYARWSDWVSIAADLMECGDIDIDFSSPPHPTNTFDTSRASDDLGVPLCRGLEGIREHLKILNQRSTR